MAMVGVTSFAANIALVIVQGGGLDNGYGRLFLVMLAGVYVPIAILILIFDRAWRTAHAQRSSYRNLEGLLTPDTHDEATKTRDGTPTQSKHPK
jgi:hypothetical protein